MFYMSYMVKKTVWFIFNISLLFLTIYSYNVLKDCWNNKMRHDALDLRVIKIEELNKMKNIKNGSSLEPSELWENFTKILNTPNPTKHEDKIVKLIKEFGENLNLETIVDEVGNIIIRKPASPGMENLKTVILQAHIDMVPQKNRDSVHDFENDPISAYYEGGWVKAEGTTLGADNGIGVAAMMTILESDTICHGPIEALFTATEESGMIGARGLKKDTLTGKVMLNLDTEEEGALYVGCAGSVTSYIDYTYKEEKTSSNVKAFKISVTDLKGGHSGVDIHLERANANKIMNRILWSESKSTGLRISSIDGGGLRNAIPRESSAIITVPVTDIEVFNSTTTKLVDDIKKEYITTDPDLKVIISSIVIPETVMEPDAQLKLLNVLYVLPNGVIRMSSDITGLVETSSNVARVEVSEGKVHIISMTRSSVDSAKLDVCNTFDSLFELINVKAEHKGNTPGWNPDMNSEILSIGKNLYIKLYGSEPLIKAIHAGLECGLFKSEYPDLDIASIGPTIMYPHSPDEKIKVVTVDRFWTYLLELLKNIPKT